MWKIREEDNVRQRQTDYNLYFLSERRIYRKHELNQC